MDFLQKYKNLKSSNIDKFMRVIQIKIKKINFYFTAALPSIFCN